MPEEADETRRKIAVLRLWSWGNRRGVFYLIVVACIIVLSVLKIRPPPPPLLSKAPIRRRLKVPTGPPTETFLRHQAPVVNDYILAFESPKFVGLFDSTFEDQVKWQDYAWRYREEWEQRTKMFRDALTDGGIEPDGTAITPVEGMTFRQMTNLRGVLQDCNCDCRKTPISEVALVFALPAHRFNESWVTLESIIYQRVAPKEVVVTVVEVNTSELLRNTYAFMTVLADIYAPRIANGTRFRVFTAPSRHMPNENRWFGFNQTSAPIVATFDGDDYMHPQYVSFIDTAFKNHLELDYALVQYAAGTITPVYDLTEYDSKILEFIREYDEGKIVQVMDFDKREYDKVREGLPTWNKTWYWGNTDAEPNWGGEEQRWWDYGCHNGWVAMRRDVLDHIQPPLQLYGGEDAIWNYRVLRAGFNYHCFGIPLGLYIKCFVDTSDRPLVQDRLLPSSSSSEVNE